MRHLKVLELLNDNVVIPVEDLAENLQLSPRSVRNIISSLKKDGEVAGFNIQTISKQGYKLTIFDAEKYRTFCQHQYQLHSYQAGGTNKLTRIYEELYFLLQQNDYITIEKIANLMEVSRNTIINDLQKMREILAEENLQLESRVHYGVIVTGDEIHYRRAFNKYVVGSDKYLQSTRSIMIFMQSFERRDLEQYLYEVFAQYKLIATKNVINAILDHLYILVYRVKKQNYISDLKINTELIEPEYLEIAEKIVHWIEQEEQIEISDLEKIYFASQIIGKTSVEHVPSIEKEELLRKITYTLKALDVEFYTEFAEDDALKASLLLHMYPLLQRMTFNLQLENPLVDDVSIFYANVFLVSLRFSELWDKNQKLDLSRDEIGYLALHFATHFETKRYNVLREISRIALVSDYIGGSVYLLKTQIESCFPNAVVINILSRNMERLIDEEIDLIITTNIERDMILVEDVAPIIFTKPLIDDEEIKKIKEEVITIKYLKDINHPNRKGILNLFSQDFFEISTASDEDYLQCIEQLAQKMVAAGIAQVAFPQSVVEREQKTSTIYKNGIAGPHSMILNALENSVYVKILKNPMTYQDKEVRIIFLINIKNGNLFLYREISDFLLKLMDDVSLINTLLQVTSFDEFEAYLEKII